MQRFILTLLIATGALSPSVTSAQEPADKAQQSVLRQQNVVAWCIVPFDAAKRGPADRAMMLKELGITRCAYDWRAEHVSTFEQEILEYRKHGIEFFAFWGVHDEAFKLFEKYKLRPQIWHMLSAPKGETQQARIESAISQTLAVARRTSDMGCQLGLYNHGGWGGEPENLVAVCKGLHALGHQHVGIVYNFHHGHGHIEDWRDSLQEMLPYLHCLNLNGMNTGAQPKILGIGKGAHDLAMIRAVVQSGYDGPIGILDHRTELDSRDSLIENRDGLRWVARELDKRGSGGELPPTPKPAPTNQKPARTSQAAGRIFPGTASYRQPPITVELRTTLPRRDQYNILVASDTKQSGEHWELFSMNGTGHLTAYLPGYSPDHVSSKAMICDGQPHTLSMTYEGNRVRLYVDGRNVADQALTRNANRAPVAGNLGIGQLVEGGLGCSGEIEWVRISKGIRPIPAGSLTSVARDDQTVGFWDFADDLHSSIPRHTSVTAPLKMPAYDPQLVEELVTETLKRGDAARGAAIFSRAKVACLSCHKVGDYGGTVGPGLAAILNKKPLAHIVESVLWPRREVKPEYTTWSVLTFDGRIVTGYKQTDAEDQLALREPTTGKTIKFAANEIEELVRGTTVMPEGLTAALDRQQQLDLFRFLNELRTQPNGLSPDVSDVLKHAGMHGPASFDFERRPLVPENWANANLPVNEHRIYEYYTKQAEHFRKKDHLPMLLAASPELDGGEKGHFGNQTESDWASDAWNQVDLGRVQSGILHLNGRSIPRAVCVRLGEQQELAVCFNPDTLQYEAVWSNGFVKYSTVRHGLLGGIRIDGKLDKLPEQRSVEAPFRYRGFYRNGERVAFAYRIGDTDYLDAPWVRNGQFVREVAPVDQHSMAGSLEKGAMQWPQRLETRITPGHGEPFAIDTIELPTDNPWNALFFCSGHDFLPDGSVVLCTMQGDVWHVSGLESGISESGVARWRRFASGLHQPLGIVATSEGVYVQCRDQLTRLVDSNQDGEADLYECFCNAFETSAGGHDFICGLQRDTDGRFYTASSNQGLLQVSADGESVRILATGFRNPDGVGLLSEGTLCVPCSEGTWTPASMICLVKPDAAAAQAPHFGFGGPRDQQPPDLPLAYLPRSMDNSSGGQAVVPEATWGPLQNQLLHLSFGMGSWFTILRDEVNGQAQGAVLPMTGDFRSGAHRARFSPVDGHLYVTGQQGWVSHTPDHGCLQRVRCTNSDFQVATGFHLHQNGVAITFAQPVDPAVVSKLGNHFVQCWNYRYSGAYGSAEYSPSHPGVQGHDPLLIASAHVLQGGHSVFLEIPHIQPVNQMHVRLHVNRDTELPNANPAGRGHDLFITAHELDEPFTEFPGYVPQEKVIAAHPILADLALNAIRVPNPWLAPVKGSRAVELRVGKNLSFAEKSVTVQPSERIALTLVNPDVVPHNWALVREGQLKEVGELANRLIADPEAFARHYIPQTEDVLYYTDIVNPGQSQTIYITAPDSPGRYPYLCTFPGHWMVMNGELVVEESSERR